MNQHGCDGKLWLCPISCLCVLRRNAMVHRSEESRYPATFPFCVGIMLCVFNDAALIHCTQDPLRFDSVVQPPMWMLRNSSNWEGCYFKEGLLGMNSAREGEPGNCNVHCCWFFCPWQIIWKCIVLNQVRFELWDLQPSGCCGTPIPISPSHHGLWAEGIGL